MPWTLERGFTFGSNAYLELQSYEAQLIRFLMMEPIYLDSSSPLCRCRYFLEFISRFIMVLFKKILGEDHPHESTTGTMENGDSITVV